MYKTNYDGQLRYKNVSRNFIQILIFVPIIHFFIVWLLYLSVGTKSILFFYSILVYVIVFLMFAFFSTFRQLNKQSRTISEIDIIKDVIIIKTDKILWLKAREYRIEKSKIYFKNRKFDFYNKNAVNEGLSVFVNNIELYLVKDYFDDYENIINLLK